MIMSCVESVFQMGTMLEHVLPLSGTASEDHGESPFSSVRIVEIPLFGA
jgi:hypothetical protein